MKAYLLTLLTAMVPVLELRAAIPLGVSQGLSLPMSILMSIIGNMIPVPFIILFIKAIFAWMREKSVKLDALVTKLENRAHLKGKTVEKYGFIGLCILVAIPLPGTGAWTGSLVAALMDIPMKKSLPAIFLGVIIAAIIVSCITYGVTAIF